MQGVAPLPPPRSSIPGPNYSLLPLPLPWWWRAQVQRRAGRRAQAAAAGGRPVRALPARAPAAGAARAQRGGGGEARARRLRAGLAPELIWFLSSGGFLSVEMRPCGSQEDAPVVPQARARLHLFGHTARGWGAQLPLPATVSSAPQRKGTQVCGVCTCSSSSNVCASRAQEMQIVDTPGTNVILERQQRLTEEYVPRADLVLFVMSADRPFSESEVSVRPRLREVRRGGAILVRRSASPLRHALVPPPPHTHTRTHNRTGAVPRVHPAVAQKGGVCGEQGRHARDVRRGGAGQEVMRGLGCFLQRATHARCARCAPS